MNIEPFPLQQPRNACSVFNCHFGDRQPVVAIEKSIRPHVKTVVGEPRDACQPVQADHRVRHGNANAGEELMESVAGFRGQGSAGMFGMCYAPTEVMPRRGRNGDGGRRLLEGRQCDQLKAE